MLHKNQRGYVALDLSGFYQGSRYIFLTIVCVIPP